MSEKSVEKKTHEHYYVGDYLWRITDNALFKITNVTLDDREGGSKSVSSYDLTCFNHTPVEDVTVYLEMVHGTGSIYTKYKPSKPVKGQHVWNTSIDPVCNDKYIHDYYHDKCENEFIVEDVVEKIGYSSDLEPCKTCHKGECKQCIHGYRPQSEVLADLRNGRKNSETIIILTNLSDHKKQTITLEQFNASFTMIPPDIYEIDKFVKEEIKSIRDNSLGCEESEEKAEIGVDDVVNDKVETESIDTSTTTVDNSYDRWRKNLKVVNVAKFDQEYFRRGLAYHVRKSGYTDNDFHGIMVSVNENTLELMKLGRDINFEYVSEIVAIPLEEYMNGRWDIVRLVEEEK